MTRSKEKITIFLISLIIIIIFFIFPPKISALWHDESIRSAPISITTSVLPHLEITRIGENKLRLSSSSSSLKITTHYLPLTIIGQTQARTKVILSYKTISTTTPSSLSTTSYPDGSFAFTIPSLRPNTNYSFSLTTQTGLPSEATLKFTLTFSPSSILATPTPQPPANYPQTLLKSNNYLPYFIVIGNLFFILGIIILIWQKRRKQSLSLLVVNKDLSPLQNYPILIVQNSKNPIIRRTNSSGEIPLSQGCYQFLDPYNPSPDLNKNYLLKSYLMYKNGTLCINKAQITLGKNNYHLSQIKRIVFVIENISCADRFEVQGSRF